MKEYFTPDGHLTDQALRDLIAELPEELERLEIAEHLSFCDRCTERYTDLLCEDCLIEPPEPLRPGVMKRIRQRARVIFLNRYVAAGVAACFTMILWLSGAFQMKLSAADTPAIVGIPQSFTGKTAELSQQFTDGVNKFFISFDLKGVFQNEKK